jgi:hypothetical protein
LAGHTFTRVGGGVLGSLQLAHRFLHVAGDLVGVDFQRLDDAIGSMMKVPRSARPSSGMCTPKARGQGVGGVADQRELGLAHRGGGFVPDLVREMRVGGDDVDLGTGLLELGVVVGSVLDSRSGS